MRILDEHQDALLRDERRLLNDLWKFLIELGLEAPDHATLEQSIQQLDELFMLVVVGEFNAGKSALINALLGQPLLQEGVTPTTTQINVLHYGPEIRRTEVDDQQCVLAFPHDMLAEISIVDTPGTNAVIREHEAITTRFVPRSDMVLFITSADRPFTESERAFLERIRDWGKKVLIVINKIDILQNEDELAEIRSFVAGSAQRLLGLTPNIMAVSARQAMRGRSGDAMQWEQGRFAALERYIHDTLDQKGRIQIKFLNPLGIATHLLAQYQERVMGRLELLQADVDMLADVDAQLAMYDEDMRRDFSFRMADLENVLFEMEQRGQDFFNETFRLARVFDLINKERLQQAFERQVVADVPQQVERKVGDLIDWLVGADLRQWQAVTEFLAERRRQHQSRIVGDPTAAGFQYDRDRLAEAVGREALRVVETFDKQREAEAMAQGAQMAVAVLAATQVGAVGLGALVTVLASTLAVDVTGVLLAGLIAALGLFIIPARRRRAQADVRARIAEMRARLIETLRSQFDREIAHSLQRINETIAPYTRFIRSERARLSAAQSHIQELQQRVADLRHRIEAL